MDVSIIIVNYNCARLLAKTITLAQKSFYSHKLKFEIIVVDNFSADDDQKLLIKLKGKLKFKLLLLKKNLGFGFACNFASHSSQGKVLLFLNPDCFPHPHSLPILTHMVLANKKSIVGPRLNNLDSTPQPSAGSFLTLPNLLLFLFAGGEHFGATKYAPPYVCSVDWLSAACFAMSSEDFANLHGFDNNIFLYTEDMELMYRAKKKNFRVVYLPQAVLTHIGMATQNKNLSLFYLYQGLVYFYKKHAGPTTLKIAVLLLTIKAYLALLYSTITNTHILRVKYNYALKALSLNSCFNSL